jgi:hypothetical protein
MLNQPIVAEVPAVQEDLLPVFEIFLSMHLYALLHRDAFFLPPM